MTTDELRMAKFRQALAAQRARRVVEIGCGPWAPLAPELNRFEIRCGDPPFTHSILLHYINYIYICVLCSFILFLLCVEYSIFWKGFIKGLCSLYIRLHLYDASIRQPRSPATSQGPRSASALHPHMGKTAKRTSQEPLKTESFQRAGEAHGPLAFLLRDLLSYCHIL